jgi:hypothetical protein
MDDVAGAPEQDLEQQRCDGRVVLYALGGGAGHLGRALALAARLGPGLILHRAAFVAARPPPGVRLLRVPGELSIPRWRRALARIASGAELFVVDTFPAGIAHEIDDDVLARARRRALVRRYVRPFAYPGYDDAAARFDDVFAPYPLGGSEWEAPAPGDRHLGYLTRRLRLSGEPERPLCVIGDARLLPVGWRALLPADTAWIEGPFEALPRARAYLSMGAGYNIAYELLALGAPFGLLPLEKRYDDQFRRAERLGRAVTTRADLARLIEAAGAQEGRASV